MPKCPLPEKRLSTPALDEATHQSPQFLRSLIAGICWTNNELNLCSYGIELLFGLSFSGHVQFTSWAKVKDLAFISTESHLVSLSSLLQTEGPEQFTGALSSAWQKLRLRRSRFHYPTDTARMEPKIRPRLTSPARAGRPAWSSQATFL